MVEVFITDITEKHDAIEIIKSIKQMYSQLKVSYDINETNLPFPYGHTVLRIEGAHIPVNTLKLMVKTSGFHCEIMEDNTYS